jgi:cytochrome c peroxidase
MMKIAQTSRTMVAAVVLMSLAGIGVGAQRGQGRVPPPPAAGAPPQGAPQGPGGGRGGPGGLAAINVPATNPLTPEKIATGKRLFFDESLSSDRKTSCATCHDPARAFTDGRVVARGVHNTAGTRNTPSLVNVGSGRSFFWDGRADSLEAQALQPMTNPQEMGLTPSEIESRTGMTTADVAAALASYMRTIRSRDSRYDWFRAGQTEMLTTDEKAGLDVFRGRGQCTVCHGGPNLTDDRFHNTGVGVRGGTPADAGRFVVTQDPRDQGAFKTPTLRDVALTAPYMHDGSLATLADVVAFYSQGGVRNAGLDRRMRPLGLSPDEQRQLVAFLKALTGEKD